MKSSFNKKQVNKKSRHKSIYKNKKNTKKEKKIKQKCDK